MNITTEPLPDYVEKVIKQVTGKTWEELGNDVVFTVGNNLHARCEVPKYLMVHELVHQKQQSESPEKWWANYTNPAFRYQQELEAYKAEYKYLRVHFKAESFEVAKEWATHLSGEMYGKCVSYNKALLDITRQ